MAPSSRTKNLCVVVFSAALPRGPGFCCSEARFSDGPLGFLLLRFTTANFLPVPSCGLFVSTFFTLGSFCTVYFCLGIVLLELLCCCRCFFYTPSSSGPPSHALTERLSKFTPTFCATQKFVLRSCRTQVLKMCRGREKKTAQNTKKKRSESRQSPLKHPYTYVRVENGKGGDKLFLKYSSAACRSFPWNLEIVTLPLEAMAMSQWNCASF